MKQELSIIYRELAGGKLSRQQALERIRALKQARASGAGTGTFLAAPSWERRGTLNADAGGASAYEQHHIIMCDLPAQAAAQIAAQLPGARCTSVSAAPGEADRLYTDVALACFATIQRILRDKPIGRCLVQVVIADSDQAQLLAGLAGLLETAALENPAVLGQILFVEPGMALPELARRLALESAAPFDCVVRYAGQDRFARRWTALEDSAMPTAVPCPFKEGGVYLVTGGLGGLGLLLAREVLRTTPGAKLVLAGRSATAGDRLPALEALRRLGEVEYRQADIGNADQTERLVASILMEHGQLNGIVHSAGVVRDDFILKKSAEQFSEVLQPKVAGTVHVDLASRAANLDFFALFSSIASWSGNLGQADYVAANGFMDQYALYRNALVAAGERKGRTVSIAWPHWLEGGMHIDAGSAAQLEARTGMRSLETAQAVETLHRCLALPHGALMVMHGDPAAMRRALAAERMAPPAQAAAAPVQRAMQKGAAATPADLVSKTRDFLRSEFSAVLKIATAKIETRAALENYGIDSILAMNLTSRLEATFGVLPKTLFFEYQSIDELADYFVGAHGDRLGALFGPATTNAQAAAAEPAAAPGLPQAPQGRRGRQRFMPAPATAQASLNEPIAIVGLSGRYPGSRDLDAYWRNLRDGVDCIVEVPGERWDWRQYYSDDRSKEGAHFSKWGGFIEGVDEFDPRFFNIAPREARTIDPQERLFLQHAWMAVEDAGYTRASLQVPDAAGLAGQVGVYAGVMYGEYNLSGSLASIANRVSYFLNLHGPSLTLDTMCSSSLTAIHLACQDLRQGRTSLALAGGVNVSVHPNKYTMLSGGQFISSDGHCQSFGEGGDGYIPGEGVGVAVLKRLSDAQRDGNHIYGIIRGSALNHGGKTNGYTVPNPQAQAEVIRRALGEAGIDPRHVSYIEAHGTGTKLGDPIEIAALTRAFREASRSTSQDLGQCLIGSAKSNIGHCESAAGIAGVTKVLLQMRHAAIVPSLHSTRLNPHIDFAATPFSVNQSLRAWDQPELDGRRLPRIAGISSFGAGGSNAHVIIEEYRVPAQGAAPAQAPVIVPLSARTAAQLEQRGRDLLAWIERADGPLDLSAIAHTLQVGREAMEVRAAVLASSIDDLAGQLRVLVDGGDGHGAVWRGQVKQHKDELATIPEEAIGDWIGARNLPKLAELWAKGLDLDWRKLARTGDVARLVSLPAYPFARERYWVEPQPSRVAVGQSAFLHPLVHANTSNLDGHAYSSQFFGTEEFLLQDATSGKMALPPLLALEMVRASVLLAAPARTEQGAWELRQVQWGDPLTVAPGRKFGMAVFGRDHGIVDVEVFSTGDGADDTVHCQARAVFSNDSAPKRIDFASLTSHWSEEPGTQGGAIVQAWVGEQQLAARLALSDRAGTGVAGYDLPPDLLHHVAELAERVCGAFSPSSLSLLRVLAPCPEQALVWVRQASDARIDIDICDGHGNVCIQFTGMEAGGAVVEPTTACAPPADVVAETIEAPAAADLSPAALVQPRAAPEPARPAQSLPREIAIATPVAIALGPVPAKPTNITLAAAAPVPATTPAARPSVSLGDPGANSVEPGSVRLFDRGEGVFAIELHGACVQEVVDTLPLALRRAAREPEMKVLLLTARQGSFWHGDREACNAMVNKGVLRAVVNFPCPVIAVLHEGATGAGMLLAALCDFMVGSDEGEYRFTNPVQGIFPSVADDRLFRERMGVASAAAFLYRPACLQGRQLRDLGWACRVAPALHVDEDAQRLASELAQKSRLALELLKTHLARRMQPLVEALASVAPATPFTEHALAAPAAPNAGDVDERAMDRARQLAAGWSRKSHRALKRIKNRLAGLAAPDAAPQASVDLAAPPMPAAPVNGALVVRLGEGQTAYGIDALVAELGMAFARVGAGAGAEYSSVIVTSALDGFLPDEQFAPTAQTVAMLSRVVRDCPVPIIAAFESHAGGLAWLFGMMCDSAVYHSDSRYGASVAWAAAVDARELSVLCGQRLGAQLGADACLGGADYSGAELGSRGYAMAGADVMAQALEQAAFWSQWPRELVGAWKQGQQGYRDALVQALPALPAPATEAAPEGAVAAPTPIALRSPVVAVTAHPDGTVVVVMQDREARNMFSEALVSGLKEAFEHIAQTPAYKVVVLTGYDSFFATGGTMETLLAIQDGQARFTDEKVFELAMTCPLPVIAAIQGHGIGGGWSFGMFADIVLLSEESRYQSPYMAYGFTPGAGSTLMFPAKIGYDLARETLLGAGEIPGQELRRRGVPLQVLPRREVVPAALDVARRIARHPRERLVALKQLWTAELRGAREDAYRREVDMHERTFVKNAQTLATIQARFGSDKAQPEARQSLPPQPVSQPRPVAAPTTADASSIVGRLRSMLAQELFLKPEEIDEDTQFIDLGLDSITGVTWIRKINAHYGTDIEATKVYSHPTLRELARLVVATGSAGETHVPVAAQAATDVDAPAVPVASDTAQPAASALNRTAVVDTLRSLLARELLLRSEEIDENTQFIDMGLDSITGVTWVRKINEHFGTGIEATKVYSHPTLSDFASLVAQEAPVVAQPPTPAPPAAPEAPPVRPASGLAAAPAQPKAALASWRGQRTSGAHASRGATQPVAIIGMAGQFPKARDVKEFWANLAEGRNCIDEVADTRWNRDAWFQPGAPAPGKTNSKWLGALDDYDKFDPLFFNISPTEAQCMEPQQRLFLEACWHSIENAGYDPQSLSGTQCGVFVGCGPSDYLQGARDLQWSAQGFTGAASSILAARISYFLNLRGPCVSLDTACSSSLVAIANACDSLNAGNSDLALAGGVYVMTGPAMHIMTSQAGMLSTDGRCFTFDQRANGFVPGEAVGVIMLKRLADAERDQDRVLAVLEGWGVNQDGKTNGITAPNEESQTRLLQSVYRKFGIDPSGIGLVEAHGTGTKLGDPIEVAGLKAAFKEFTTQPGYCALGSVKSNIGHCLPAAGAAGIIKLILALRHRALPPSIHFERCNEHIQLEGSPFYVNTALKPWNVAAGARRRAAISSFGFSGTNAHLVLAEHAPAGRPMPASPPLKQDGKVIVPLSARTADQLRQAARNLLDHIRATTEPIDLVELAYTLQVGRAPMGERLALMAASIDALAAGLEAFVAGHADIDGVTVGQVKRHKEGMKLITQDDELRATIVDKWLGQGKLSKLADLWVKGLDLDWELLYGQRKPQRIDLPNYPFARDRYWIEADDAATAQPAVVRPSDQPGALPAPVTPPSNLARTAGRRHAWDQASYLPEWVEQAFAAHDAPAPHRNVLIVRTDACFGLDASIGAHYARNPSCQVLHADMGGANGWVTCIEGMERIDALYFVAASEAAADPESKAQLRASQEANEVGFLRLIKALKQSGKIDSQLDTWVLTVDNHPFERTPNRYWGAGASGLAYSLAQGNHQFKVRNLDLSSADLVDEEARCALAAAIADEPPTDRGELVKLARGKRYRQSFLRLDWGSAAPSALKHGGVYVIVGGSGIVGRVITRKLLERYQAHVIWLGRAEPDAPKIRAAFDAVPGSRDRVDYIQADALSETALRAALDQVKRKHSRVNGAIFAGMVFGTENSIDQTTEEQFRDILEVKTIGSQAFYAALRDEPLDFMCFFSSGQGYAFSGAAKLCGYASGIAFADSFVRSISAVSRFPVGTINWGFWQAAVTERIEKLDNVSTRSLAALGDEEGFDCFERFVGELQHGRLRQVLCMRASPEVEALMNCSADQSIALASGSGAGAVVLDEQSVQVSQQHIDELVAARQASGLDYWFALLLLCQLDRLRKEAGVAVPCTVEQLGSRCAIVGKYEPWLRQSLAMLATDGLVEFDGTIVHRWDAPDFEAAWSGWRDAKQAYVRDRATEPLAVLIDECLEKLPAILRGTTLATDVIFPKSSMDKVAGLYRNNPTADTFNEIVAGAVRAYVEERLRREPGARVRILEVGAGTGGTSAVVFAQLAKYKAAIEEYCYTDLSKAFFFHAERNYLPENPYIVCRKLDIEQPIEAQGIVAGSYDLVLSTNALHATRDIRRTLRHAKSALRKDGYIIVSEMADCSLSTHLTFGLLDGWWLFEDAELRIPGCPGLYPETWRQVLEQEGFDSVLLPGSAARALGNQVVLARSDGVMRLPLSAGPIQASPQPAQATPLPAPRKPRGPQPLAQPVIQDLPTYVHDAILECLSATLKIPAPDIETDIAFSDYGIDSILGVNFIDQVNARLGVALNTAIIFEYSSIERLARHLVDAYGKQIEAAGATPAANADALEDVRFDLPEAEPVASVMAVAQAPAPLAAPRGAVAASSEIAVVGMSGKFPKADSVEQFWQNLVDGVDGIEEVPAEYLDQAAAYSTVKHKGKTRCKWAGILADRDCFDPLFFSISPKEAESMNPHQRLVMQESWNAIEDAGYNPKALAGSQTAIFIGAEPAGYVGDTFTGLSDAIIASRLSYALNFNGAAFVVNTGCSSSAVAIHLACENLRNGESDLVLAGGVNACLHQEVLVRLDQIEMLSASGRCYTFDKAADGTVISEGVGMLVLKRLDDALAAGDHVYATICGSGMNQDGASNGITAPNGAAQEQLIAGVYDRFGINAEQISYVEAHGTGTKLGDPVETNALVRAFRRYSDKNGWCAVGSAKSHIGHAAAAAGVIGIIKVLLSMRHREFPKLLNFREMNPLIQFDGSPFYITSERTEWRCAPGVPRMAAINSFGHSGTNVHLVVKEFEQPRAVARTTGKPLAFPLSARTPEQLRQKGEDLLRHIGRAEGEVDLAAMAYTLQAGREAMEERVGFAADSLPALVHKLRGWLDGDANLADVFEGRVARAKRVAVPDRIRTASPALQAWTQGAAVDWEALWDDGARPGRASLPGYPFAKERYWMESAFGPSPAAAAASAPAPVPAAEAAGTSIEDILDRIADESIETDEGIHLLKMVV
jgi:acyl transferase domain-containing protein/enoyl-CoA hydratase/carnithine racemase/acyl carrier protein/short-subunit dehydrogenase/SAM-dependent methyltransferase